MDLTIYPRKLSGEIEIIPSKSLAHRYMICAAFADAPTELICRDTNQDIEATAACLRALGTDILRTDNGYRIHPVDKVPRQAVLNCGESGSTLRFLLPVAGALGVDATFIMEGRLPHRPLSPLWEEMERKGCRLTRTTENALRCTGKLQPGIFTIDGGISSQFITGLLFALACIDGECDLEITGNVESAPYIHMTRSALSLFGSPDFHSPGSITVEGDWSNGAFFLAARELGSDIYIRGLNPDSIQGDRAAGNLIPALKDPVTVDASDIPDLVPILSVVAAACQGADFINIQRLRFKESDRVAATIAMIERLGGKAAATNDTLKVYGTGLTGGTVDSHNDHRIAMAAAIAATVCTEPVTVLGADSVNKSYPKFWDEYRRLGGNYEQHIR